FYPPDLKQDRMLGFYAGHLPTVEINVSFYRMPTSKMLEDWKAQTPPHFRFAVKAHRRITHIKRLRDVDEEVRWLHERVTERGGPITSGRRRTSRRCFATSPTRPAPKR